MSLDKNSSVLIIEDNPINRQVIKVLFKKTMGLELIEEWETSDCFMEKMISALPKPDLIIMDIMMLPIDGFEMISQLRSASQFDEVKVIAYTASVMKEQIDKMKLLGFDGLISKPITREIFPQLIHRIMAGESIWYVS